ncbi:hypothetical protein BAUCODRAFT_170444 [Baudoinia panamericana UAMH 10762]|uniref:Zn(2)-C6 fungal-type domain-containing protein n=1 Tax=Baudoinia panamericana (strain UAMH 10762) TaxID=717646 RepID=M2NLV9_BAUPA|nr:uncharacterized protein BAUCODRAFT_170444 [Baudoinia panamericana UAMH 10762]EMD00480.1 hypothetical protein BAUCODRAFT_170444 [Baudoinia panamericana UAMH 10762]
MADGRPALPHWHTATSAHLLDARQRNGRLGSRKSRGGCITCKARRVKCDEQRPLCRRCTSVGRKCEGYVERISRSSSSGNALVASPTATQFLAGRENDTRTFDFFVSFSAPRMAGCFDKTFWCGYLLQLSHSEPLVLDCVLAISTLYEHPQYLTSFHRVRQHTAKPEKGAITSTESASDLDEHHAKALQVYNRAISEVRRRVEDASASPLIVLLSCVLFVCIELIRDNIFSALALLSKGNQLLKQFANMTLIGDEHTIFRHIKPMLARIDVLAGAFGIPHPVEVPAEFVVIGQHRVFSSTMDARTAIYGLMAESHDFIKAAAVYKASILDGQLYAESECVMCDLMSETGAAVLPATVNLRTGDGATKDNNETGLGGETCPSKKGHKGRTRLFGPKDVLMYESVSQFCDCEEEPCLAAQHHGKDEQPSMWLPLHGKASVIVDTVSAPEQATSPNLAFTSTPLLSGSSPPLSMPTAPPSALLDKQRYFENRLGQWYDALHWTRTSATPQDTEAASNLLMYYHISQIWLTTRLVLNQTVFDEYTHHFQQILHHAETLLGSRPDDDPPVFTFEVGIVPPLYFVATKCRIPSLRRQALRLLARAPKKECMWGANSTRQMAARIVAIEEEGLDLPEPELNVVQSCEGTTACDVDDSRLPPEANRVHNVEILANKVTGVFEVRVTRYRLQRGGLRKVVQDYPI